MVASAPLFAPFRALGYVCDDVPLAVQRIGKETFITVSVGNTWQVYNCAKITLVLVGPPLPTNITFLAAAKHHTFAALDDGTVHVAHRATPEAILPAPDGATKSTTTTTKYTPQLLLLGRVLLVLHPQLHVLAVWDLDSDLSTPQRLVSLPADFHATCMCHPDTYLNKIVVGSNDGRLAVYNFATGRCLYESTVFCVAADATQQTSTQQTIVQKQQVNSQHFVGKVGTLTGVSVLVASPGLDVIGVGLADGRVALHNIKYDETVVEFSNASGAGLRHDMFLTNTAAAKGHALAEGGGGAQGGVGDTGNTPVMAMAFRTGGGVPLMVAGGGAGVVTVWNLETRRLHGVIKDAHDAPIVNLVFFPGQPIVMSQGADNAIKHWIFDNTDGSARLLRFRSGHSAPPVRVRGYGEEARRLLSAGSDRAFRMLSIVQDQQSRELSQGHVERRSKRLKVTQEELKLPPVVALDACPVRERDWCNVLTAHEGDAAAYVWRLQHFCLGDAVLRIPKEVAKKLPKQVVEAPATAVCISRCGNFGCVGSASGRLDRYNMQSGLHRGGYSRNSSSTTTTMNNNMQHHMTVAAHDGAVTGVATDSTNTVVVTVGHDGWLRVWDFKRHGLLGQVNVGAPCVCLDLHPTSLLAGVACAPSGGSDGSGCGAPAVRVYDVSSRQLVRRFVLATRNTTKRSGGGGGSSSQHGVHNNNNNSNSTVTNNTQIRGVHVRDVCISADGRWLLAGSSEGLVCVWDIAAGHMLQVLDMCTPVSSLTLSPTLDLLATTHDQQRGISLWSNQMLFGAADAIVPSTTPIQVCQPGVSTGNVVVEKGGGEGGENRGEEQGGGKGEGEVQVGGVSLVPPSSLHAGGGAQAAVAKHTQAAGGKGGEVVLGKKGGEVMPAPLAPSLVTMSLLPKAQWSNLVHMDAIKERSKPIQPPKKPAAAPFFLPTLPGLSRTPVFDVDGEEGDHGDEMKGELSGSRVLSGVRRAHLATSPFISTLRTCYATNTWSPFSQLLQSLPPTALDTEVHSMTVLPTDDAAHNAQQVEDVQALLCFIQDTLRSNRGFDFAQALLQVVLRVHADTIAQHDTLRQVAGELQGDIGSSWGKLEGMLQQVRCMATMFGGWHSG